MNEQSELSLLDTARSRIGKELVNKETGEILSFTTEDLADITELENSIKVAAWQMARGLHTIRRRCLYLLYGFDSWADYAKERLGMSARNASRYVHVVNAVGSGHALEELLSALPLTKALVAVQDDDFTEALENSESKEEISRLVDEKTKDLKEEKKRLRRELEAEKNRFSSFEETKRVTISAYERKIQEQQSLIDAMAKERGIDPERLRKIRNKEELVSSILDAETVIHKHLSTVSDPSIPTEEYDREIAVRIQRLIAILKDWQLSLSDTYAGVLFPLVEKEQSENI